MRPVHQGAPLAPASHGAARLRGMGRRSGLAATVDEQRERLVANRFVDPHERSDKWWFAPDEVDGELAEPTGRNENKICREYPLQR